MVITQDKAVFVWVISLNFHSKNFSLLFCKLDLAKIHPTQQDLLCSYGYSQTNEHFIFLWYLLLGKKTNKKTPWTPWSPVLTPNPFTGSSFSLCYFIKFKTLVSAIQIPLPVTSPLWSPILPPSHLHSGQPSWFLAHTWHKQLQLSLSKQTTSRMRGHCCSSLLNKTTARGA